MYVFCSFQFLPTVEQIRASWVLFVKKPATWHNSLFQKFGKSMLQCLAFMPETPIWRFHSNWLLIWEFEKCWMSSMVITKVQQLESLTLVILMKKTPELVGQIQAMIDKDPSKSISFIARNTGVSEFHIRHEDIQGMKTLSIFHTR